MDVAGFVIDLVRFFCERTNFLLSPVEVAFDLACSGTQPLRSRNYSLYTTCCVNPANCLFYNSNHNLVQNASKFTSDISASNEEHSCTQVLLWMGVKLKSCGPPLALRCLDLAGRPTLERAKDQAMVPLPAKTEFGRAACILPELRFCW
uniref:Uncharacterized protein n=1 Tax=Micrurus spixii TaxID=129469 RepID=A0A2D4N6G0_9SAUR